MTRRNSHPRREAFTIVELLVVIAILSILAGLTAVAVFGIGGNAQEKASKANVEKIQAALMQHWAAATDTAKGEPLPAPVLQMAWGQANRARIIWTKLRLRQEFPQSYAEALNPAVGSTIFGLGSVLQPKSDYFQAVQRATQPGMPTSPPEIQNSEMLLLALKQSRRGGLAFNPDESFSNNAIKDTNGNGLPEIVDSWGNPITFFRWGYGHPRMTGATQGAPGGIDNDTEDPTHRLMSNRWNVDGSQGVMEFEQMLHPIHVGSGASWRPTSYYTEPTVLSFGKDGAHGLDLRNMAPVNPGQEADNIYGYLKR